MSKIILIVCFVYIVYLYRSDIKNNRPNVTGALWIPLIWVLIISSRTLSQWFNLGAPAGGVEAFEEGNPFDRNIYLILYVISFIVLIKRRVQFATVIVDNPWVAIYLFYAGLGIFWSDYPLVSFKRYIKEIGNILIALVLLTEPRPIEALITLVKRCAYAFMPLSIVLYKYFPAMGRYYHRWSGEASITGVAMSKNHLGALCMICGIILFISLFQKWRKEGALTDKKNINDLIIFAMAVGLLIKAYSSTSIVCFTVGISMYLALGTSTIQKRVQSLGRILIVTGVAILIISYAIDIVGVTASSFGKDETLSGRTEIWEHLTTKSTNPLFGVGYESYWLGERMQELWDIYWFHPTQAHNGYIEIYINLGLIGICLMFGAIIFAFRTNVKRIVFDFDNGRLMMVLFTITIIYNITETATRAGQLMYFVLMLTIIKSRQLMRGPDQRVMNMGLHR